MYSPKGWDDGNDNTRQAGDIDHPTPTKKQSPDKRQININRQKEKQPGDQLDQEKNPEASVKFGSEIVSSFTDNFVQHGKNLHGGPLSTIIHKYFAFTNR